MSDRPVSRRGTFEPSTPSLIGIPLRPVTGVRGTTARPQSSLRIGTASRLAAASSMGISTPPTGQRIGTALGFAGNMMAERPITQHGLSGLPTASGRIGTASGMRQVKDKRYWMAQLQMKMTELINETEKLMKEKNGHDREKSAKRLYEKKVKEAAKELTNLQSHLTDMNVALDSFSSGLTRQHMQNEATAIRERNENFQNSLENLFKERQTKENQNKIIETEIQAEKNKINEMIMSLSPGDQTKYRELQNLAESLKMENAEQQNQIETLVNQKDSLTAAIFNSQSRLDAVRLQTKLKETTMKRNTLKEEEDNRLTPAQEREKLINEVRANNQALTSIGRQMKLLEDQLTDKKELLQQVEQDLEEGNSERHAKYKELRRRDETMTEFMENFHQSMENEKKHIETLKNQIAYAIEQITVQGINMKSFDIEKSEFSERNDLNSHNGLLKEYKKLAIQLKQLQILEKRTNTQLKTLLDEEMQAMEDISKFENLQSLRTEAANNMSMLTSTLEELRHKRKVTEDVVKESQNRCKEIKEHLKSNETYRQISHLEEKLTDLIKENKTLQESVEQSRYEYNYSDVKELAETNLKSFMVLLNTHNSRNY